MEATKRARKIGTNEICKVACRDRRKNNQGHLTHESVIAVKEGEVLARSAEKSTQ